MRCFSLETLVVKSFKKGQKLTLLSGLSDVTLHKNDLHYLPTVAPAALFIFSFHYHTAAVAKQPNISFLHKHRETTSKPSNSGAGRPPPIYFNGMCVFHKYLICEIAADICLRARGANMQSNCEILITPPRQTCENGTLLVQETGSVCILIAQKDKA